MYQFQKGVDILCPIKFIEKEGKGNKIQYQKSNGLKLSTFHEVPCSIDAITHIL